MIPSCYFCKCMQIMHITSGNMHDTNLRINWERFGTPDYQIAIGIGFFQSANSAFPLDSSVCLPLVVLHGLTHASPWGHSCVTQSALPDFEIEEVATGSMKKVTTGHSGLAWPHEPFKHIHIGYLKIADLLFTKKSWNKCENGGIW